MNKKHVLLGAAMAGLTLSVATACSPESQQAKAGECHGVNACKGQGACGGTNHECAGKNECKGKGWIEATAEDCQKQGGKYVEPGKGAHSASEHHDASGH